MYKLISGELTEVENELNTNKYITYVFPFTVTTNYDGRYVYHLLVLIDKSIIPLTEE